MKPFKTQAHINSLDGAMDKITVLEETMNGRQTNVNTLKYIDRKIL